MNTTTGKKKKNKTDFKHNSQRPNTPRQSHPQGKKKKQAPELDTALFQKRAVAPKEAKAYTPSRKISELPIDQMLRDNLLKKGYEYPTEIQDKSLDAMLDRRDVMGIAQT